MIFLKTGARQHIYEALQEVWDSFMSWKWWWCNCLCRHKAWGCDGRCHRAHLSDPRSVPERRCQHSGGTDQWPASWYFWNRLWLCQACQEWRAQRWDDSDEEQQQCQHELYFIFNTFKLLVKNIQTFIELSPRSLKGTNGYVLSGKDQTPN